MQHFSLNACAHRSMVPSLIPQPRCATRSPSRDGKSQKHRCFTLRSTVGPVFTHLCAFAFSWNLGCIYHCVFRCNINARSQLLESRSNEGPSFDCQRIHRRREAPTSPNDSVPRTITKLFVGATTVNYTEFVSSFALGAPLQGASNPEDVKATVGGSRVLFLHQTPSSHSTVNRSDDSLSSQSLRTALSHCREVKQVVVHLGKRNERSRGTCVALVGKTESYHLNKWIQDTDTTDGEHSLIQTNKYQFLPEYGLLSGLLSSTPASSDVLAFFDVASGLMEAVDDAMLLLQPLSDKVADAGDESVKGTIVVMVSNSGHEELLVNFVCSARANGVDLSKVLMFATDAEVHEIALSLGLASFFNEAIFRSIPQRAATIYGDDTYARIMLSKSFVTFLASRTGHDFIFQDVDIIPYRSDYWSWWTAKKDGDYDLYFQQDFNVRPEYAPWVANSGSYFAKNNARTKSLFSSFFWRGDMILQARSHQAAFHVALSEHASQYGLRIKTLQSEHGSIPNGWHFHRNFAYMRRILSNNKTEPYAFHMNWNTDKAEKKMMLEQIGDWYVREECTKDDELARIANASSPGSRAASDHLATACCLSTPAIRCYFRDKPSVPACRNHADLKSIEQDVPSFW